MRPRQRLARLRARVKPSWGGRAGPPRGAAGGPPPPGARLGFPRLSVAGKERRPACGIPVRAGVPPGRGPGDAVERGRLACCQVCFAVAAGYAASAGGTFPRIFTSPECPVSAGPRGEEPYPGFCFQVSDRSFACGCCQSIPVTRICARCILPGGPRGPALEHRGPPQAGTWAPPDPSSCCKSGCSRGQMSIFISHRNGLTPTEMPSPHSSTGLVVFFLVIWWTFFSAWIRITGQLRMLRMSCLYLLTD